MLCELVPWAARENTALVRFSSTCRKKSIRIWIMYHTHASRTRRDGESQWSYSNDWMTLWMWSRWLNRCLRSRPTCQSLYFYRSESMFVSYVSVRWANTRCALCALCARPLRRRLLWQRYEHDSPISGRSLRCACALYLVDGSLSNNRAVLLSFIDHRI